MRSASLRTSASDPPNAESVAVSAATLASTSLAELMICGSSAVASPLSTGRTESGGSGASPSMPV
jgi:hypothetical protein